MGTTPKIVLVDGDAAVRTALTFSLELDGFSIEAHATAEAVACQDPLPCEGCLVLDQNLPGMDGLALVSLLRDQRVNLPAVLITTQPKAALRLRAAEAGVTIVEKPLLGDTLVQAVRETMRRVAEAYPTVAAPVQP